jgi:hypothetical protein
MTKAAELERVKRAYGELLNYIQEWAAKFGGNARNWEELVDFEYDLFDEQKEEYLSKIKQLTYEAALEAANPAERAALKAAKAAERAAEKAAKAASEREDDEFMASWRAAEREREAKLEAEWVAKAAERAA